MSSTATLKHRPDAGAGMVRTLWMLATAEEPRTASELAAAMDVNREMVRKTLRTLYERGFVLRRVRDDGQFGRHPFEYALASREVVSDA